MQFLALDSVLAALPPQMPALPDLPPGPLLDRVRGPIEIPPYESWQIGLFVALGTIVLGLICWGIIRLFNKRKSRMSKLPPDKAALAELQAAAELTTGDDERFAVLSSLALRRYFEVSKGIATLKQTTLEFLKELEYHSQLNREARVALAEFLEHCDRVKFAQASLNETQRNALTESACKLITQFEQAADAPPKENMQP